MRPSFGASLMVAGLFVATAVLLLFLPPLTDLMQLVAKFGWLSRVLYVLLLATAVVCAPVTVVPLIPLATQLFGPLATGVLSVLGWTLGSAIAFLIARHAARPLLLRFVQLDRLEEIAAKVTPRTQFWGIVLLRHLVPVDVLSYALGLIPTVSFTTYLGATFLGVIWFSFAFAYLGEALVTQNLYALTSIIGASLAVLLIGWYLLRRT